MKTTYKLENRHKILVLIIVLSVLVDWRISTGIIIGYFFALLHSKVFTYRFNITFETRVTSKKLMFVCTLFDLIIIAIPMAMAFVLPGVFSFAGVFIGLVYEKYCLYVGSFKKKG